MEQSVSDLALAGILINWKKVRDNVTKYSNLNCILLDHIDSLKRKLETM